MLDNINRLCDAIGLPYISAMVISKTTGLPGPGFRELCINVFGYDEALKTQEIFMAELEKIKNCPEWGRLIRLREKYLTDSHVQDLVTTEDILFSSSSAAADFVLGYSVSGPKTWKANDGRSLKEVEDSKSDS